MSYQHTIQNTVNSPGGNVSKQNAYDGAQHSGYYNDALPAATGTTVANFSVDVSEMVALLISCDRDVTLTFNDDGSPDATVNLLAGVPLIWTDDGYFANPLGSTDITSFKATLASGATATLLLDVVYD